MVPAGWPPELGILAGTVVAAVLGLVVGLISIRRQGIYFAMVTLAMAQMNELARSYLLKAALPNFARSKEPKTDAGLENYIKHANEHGVFKEALDFAHGVAAANQPAAAAAPADPVMAKIASEKAMLNRFAKDLLALEVARNTHTPLDPKVLAELRTLPAELNQMKAEVQKEYRDLQSQMAHNPQLAKAVEDVGQGIWNVTQQMHQDALGYGWNGAVFSEWSHDYC